MTITNHPSASEIRQRIRNFPLVIFYLIVIGLIVIFSIYFQSSLILLMPPAAIFILTAIAILITCYFLIKSIYGYVVVKISREEMTIFEGVFGVGRHKSFPTVKVDRIYVKKNVGNASSDGLPYAWVKQYLVIEGASKIKLLNNQVPLHQAKEFCDELNAQLSNYQF